jgi:hypothetical protein
VKGLAGRLNLVTRWAICYLNQLQRYKGSNREQQGVTMSAAASFLIRNGGQLANINMFPESLSFYLFQKRISFILPPAEGLLVIVICQSLKQEDTEFL